VNDDVKAVRKTRMQGLALLLLVFFVGALVGGAVERIRVTSTRPARPTFMPGELPPPFERLGLTDEQRSQIRAIFEASRPITDSILLATMPRLQAVHDSVRSAMQEVLTPEQLEQLEQLGEFGRPMEWRREGLERFRRPPPPRDTPDSLPRPWDLPDSARRHR